MKTKISKFLFVITVMGFLEMSSSTVLAQAAEPVHPLQPANPPLPTGPSPLSPQIPYHLWANLYPPTEWDFLCWPAEWLECHEEWFIYYPDIYLGY